MRHLMRKAPLWLAALGTWFLVLWMLSSMRNFGKPIPGDHTDKLLHFLYFFAGGVLFTGWRFFLNPGRPDWRKIIPAAIIVIALVGVIDEWHQCYTPGRSGGDVWDWTADLIGAIAGSIAFRAIHHRLQ